MFQDEYRKDMEAVGPTEEQLARLMAALAEQEEAPMKTMKLTLKAVLIAAALCVAMAVTVLAVSPGLREALGAFWPYSQTMKGMTVVDQGIEVKVVSALSDGNVIRLYVTARDLEGDRLDEFTSTNFQMDMPSQSAGQWKSGTLYLPELVSYDPETKTALFTTGLVGDGLPLSDLTVTAGAQVFTPGQHEFRFQLPELGTPGTVRSKTLDSGETVLLPGQTPKELESDVFSLSSYGFGGDGKLHILYQLHVPVEKAYMNTFLSSRIGEAGDLAGNALRQRYNRGSQDILFREDGVVYYDFSYEVGPEDGVDVLPREVYGSIESGKEIKGTWKFEIPLKNAEVRSIDLSGSNTVISGTTGTRILLTSIGVTVEGNPEGNKGMLTFPVTVFMDDGSRIHGAIDSNHYDPNYCSAHSSFSEPLDIDRAVGVAIGQWYIPIEGNTAQPGSWLPEIP